MITLRDVVMTALISEGVGYLAKGISKSEDVGSAAAVATAGTLTLLYATADRDDEEEEE